MAKRGTTAKIGMAEMEKLSMMPATDEEIAAWFGVTTRTIERRRIRSFICIRRMETRPWPYPDPSHPRTF